MLQTFMWTKLHSEFRMEAAGPMLFIIFRMLYPWQDREIIYILPKVSILPMPEPDRPVMTESPRFQFPAVSASMADMLTAVVAEILQAMKLSFRGVLEVLSLQQIML